MKKKFIVGVVLLFIVSLLVGCGSKGSVMYTEAEDLEIESVGSVDNSIFSNSTKSDGVAQDIAVLPKEDMQSQEQNQKLIKTGYISLEVRDTKEAYNAIKVLSEKNQGYFVDLQEYNYSNNARWNITLKVKAENLETLYAEIKKLGKVNNSSVSTKDVTTEYIDISARLKTLKVQETTLQNIMAKAVSVEDLLKVEQELQRVRQSIESTQGQLNYYDNAISYSVIEIEMYSEEKPTQIKGEKDKGIFERFWFSLRDGVGFWGGVFFNIIASIFWLLPILIVGCVIIIFVKKLLYIKKQKKARITNIENKDNK